VSSVRPGVPVHASVADAGQSSVAATVE